MATVRLSQSLTNEILEIAGRTQDKAVVRAIQTRPSNDWAEKIYDTLFDEDVIALVDKVPEHWFDMVDTIRLRSIGSLDGSMLEFKFTAPKRWPRKVDNDLAKTSYIGLTTLDLTHSLVWGELHAEVAAWIARVSAAETKKKEFLEGIRAVLASHSTLAPALKEWPPLWDFIPEDVKAKHKEVSTRGKKPEVKHDVDISKLTSMAVAAKIG